MIISVTSITQYSAVLNATALIWSGLVGTAGRRDNTYNFIRWEWKEITAVNWIGLEEQVAGKPASLSYQIPDLAPNKTYQYRVTQTSNGRRTVKTGTFDTLTSNGRLIVSSIASTAIGVSFIEYNSTSYTRVAKFTYGRKPTEAEPKPTVEEWGQIIIPPNTTSVDVSEMITGLKNDKTYTITMTMYRERYHNQHGTLTVIDRYTVEATTKLADDENPSVVIESIRKRYDSSDLTIDLFTDYPGLYRFVVNVCDDQDGVCWRTLILPPMENRLTVENCLVAFRQASFVRPGVYVYTQKSNIDIKAGIIVESDTEDIESLGYNYPIGNAKDKRLDHLDTIDGVTIYGETDPITIGFDETTILNYQTDDPCGVLVSDVLNLTYILFQKWDTRYRDWTAEDWLAWIDDEGYDTTLRRDLEDPSNTIESMMELMNQWYRDIYEGMRDAIPGNPVSASDYSLVKNLERLAQEITRARGWSYDVDLDAQSGEDVEASYFNKLSAYVKYVR